MICLHIFICCLCDFDTEQAMIEIFHLIKIDFKILLINNELKFIPAVMGTANLLRKAFRPVVLALETGSCLKLSLSWLQAPWCLAHYGLPYSPACQPPIWKAETSRLKVSFFFCLFQCRCFKHQTLCSSVVISLVMPTGLRNEIRISWKMTQYFFFDSYTAAYLKRLKCLLRWQNGGSY